MALELSQLPTGIGQSARIDHHRNRSDKMAKLGEMMDFHFDFWVRNKAPVHLILSQNAFFLYDKDLIQPGLRKLAVLFSSKTGQLKNAYAGNMEHYEILTRARKLSLDDLQEL